MSNIIENQNEELDNTPVPANVFPLITMPVKCGGGECVICGKDVGIRMPFDFLLMKEEDHSFYLICDECAHKDEAFVPFIKAVRSLNDAVRPI